MEYNYHSMHTNQRPPLAAKKGIAVLQPSRTQKVIESDVQSSGARSVRSSSRSRGISIGRSSGIKMDKIYEQKHFPILPPPSEEAKSVQNLEKTLMSCKSLKLVSLQSETSLSNDKESSLKESMDQEASNFKLKISSKVEGKERSSSPIGKLNFAKESHQNSNLSAN
jgi:hypothetical protein